MSKLVDFLQTMGRDAELRDEFEKDADAVMSRFELSDEEKQAIREGDLDTVKRLSGLTNVQMTHSSVNSYDDE